LRRAALSTIPSMRHLDMGKRLEHMAGLGFQPQTIVDVGAAEGTWSRMAAGIWPNARLIGFEPNRTNEAKLERTRRELPQFAYHLCFLGAEIGRVTYVDRGTQTSLYTDAPGSDDAEMRTVSLTTEQDGIGMATGAWLGGVRSALLMQSSGVGNCINALSLIKNCQIPFLTFITMRGDFGEANNWQMAMGQATPTVLEAMGMVCLRVERAEDIEETVAAALRMSFLAQQSIAVLLSQRLIGAKVFK